MSGLKISAFADSAVCLPDTQITKHAIDALLGFLGRIERTSPHPASVMGVRLLKAERIPRPRQEFGIYGGEAPDAVDETIEWCISIHMPDPKSKRKHGEFHSFQCVSTFHTYQHNRSGSYDRSIDGKCIYLKSELGGWAWPGVIVKQEAAS